MNEKLSLICYSNSQRHGELVNEEICMSNWSQLGGHDWSYLLEHQPRFADKCDWSKLDGCDWADLLSDRAEFAEKCDWGKLEAINWRRLVSIRPEFVDRCDMGKFTGGQIVLLFRDGGSDR